MTAAIITTLCVMLLIAYIFDLSSSRTKIPSVILLLFLGWGARQLSVLFEIRVPDLSSLLPVFGTVGLILIVLEGALELELNRSKATLIGKSFVVALVPILVLAALFAFFLQYFGVGTFKVNMLNALPLCVISSSIAIPSAGNLSHSKREFVIYETSLSDIIGVLLFNFILVNDGVNLANVTEFGIQLVIMIVISFVATLGLAFLMKRIDHRIKFGPTILLVILIYEVSKIYHLPGLVFILFLGLILGNLDELKWLSWVRKLDPQGMDKEIHKFRELTGEAAFLVRSIFFVLFGYLIETTEVLNADTFVWALGVTLSIFIIRAVLLRLTRAPMLPLVWIAPRGLITILLFFSIDPDLRVPLVNRSLIIQVIVFTALIMMFGMMLHKRKEERKGNEVLDKPVL